MRPVKNAWPTSDLARNVKFAAQVFREALSDDKFESFRVASLDVTTQLRELIGLSRDARRGRFPIKTLFPCIAELKTSIVCDPTAQRLVGAELALIDRSFSEGQLSEKNIHLLTALCRSMFQKLNDNYKEVMTEEFCEEMKTPKNSEKIRRSVNSYCAHLINSGYSRQHVQEVVEDWFFSRSIKKVESRTTARFLSKFDGKTRTFVVYLPVSQAFGGYIGRLEFEDTTAVPFGSLPAAVQTAFQQRGAQYTSLAYVRTYVQAKDDHAALREADEMVNALLAITYISPRGIKFDNYDWTYVALRRGVGGRLISRQRPFLQQVSGTVTQKTLKGLQDQTRRIFSEFTAPSTLRLLSAVNMAGLARATSRPENQLVALWSAIEVLLSDPPPGESRVKHYVDTFTPCICARYVRRYIVAVYDELQLHYPRYLRQFFRQPEFPSDHNQYTKFALLLYDPAFAALQRPFCAGLADNPLALYRLWKVEKNFNNPANFLQSFNQHEKRVRWHLHRIYRTRNIIVHNGQKPTFLVPLLVNVFEYFQGSVGPILGRASAAEHERSLDQIVAEIRFDVDMMKDDLRRLEAQPDFSTEQILKYHR